MLEFAKSNIHWYGHDAFRISGSKTVYFDPYKIPSGAPKADLVLVTHEHFDHFSPEDIDRIQTEETVLVAPHEVVRKWPGQGKKMKPEDKVTLGGIKILAVPAYNIGKKFHPQANHWNGYVIEIDGVRIYHAGDTDLIPEMSLIDTDIALLPVSGTYVMTVDEAVKAALRIKTKLVIPMHYGDVVGSPDDGKKFCEAMGNRIPTFLPQKS